MIQIDKNVPIPEGQRTTSKYPLDNMEVGDSFFVLQGKKPSLYGYIHQWKNKHGKSEWEFHFVQSEEGTRVWRTK